MFGIFITTFKGDLFKVILYAFSMAHIFAHESNAQSKRFRCCIVEDHISVLFFSSFLLFLFFSLLSCSFSHALSLTLILQRTNNNSLVRRMLVHHTLNRQP